MDRIDGVEVTCIDNGMPVVILRAADMGITGEESRESLDQNDALKARLESIRLKAGPMMNLGDVRDRSVPKMTMVSPARTGGVISTRSFIPHRCHASIGVLGAVSVATACALPGSTAAAMAKIPQGRTQVMAIEHPIGESTIVVNTGREGEFESASVLLTARKLFDGVVFGR